jgi:hypothetical protein
MRRSLRLAFAGLAVSALTVALAAPAGAQETLGFEIDPVEGPVGSTVNGQVDTDDVAEHCTTAVADFQALFGERLDLVLESVFGTDNHVAVLNSNITSFEELVGAFYFLIRAGTSGLDPPLDGLAPGDEDLAAGVLAQTFVMTFADIATQQPVGETGNFDPNTGEGSVVVPDVDPGLWAVAAACVSPTTDPDVIAAAVSGAAEFVEAELDFEEPFPTVLELALEGAADGPIVDTLQEIGPTLIAPLMEPDAFGFDIFCVFDETGVCPVDDVPDDVEEPGAPRPAEPVVVEPVFTG